MAFNIQRVDREKSTITDRLLRTPIISAVIPGNKGETFKMKTLLTTKKVTIKAGLADTDVYYFLCVGNAAFKVKGRRTK